MSVIRMSGSLIKHAGTWMPLIVIGFVVLAAINQAVHTKLTWELLIVYGVGATSLLLGTWALIQLARYSQGRYPSFLILSFIYHKLALAVLFVAIFMFAANRFVPWFPHFPEALTYPLLVGSVAATAILNGVLFHGRTRGWLEEEVDPMPFRALFREWRSRRGRG